MEVELIPRVARFIWIGCSMPAREHAAVDQFRRLHPGWKVEVCRDYPGDMPEALVEEAAAGGKRANQTDVWRLWLLWTRGGFHFDTDMIFVRPVDDLRLLGGFVSGSRWHPVTTFAMGATPGHPMIDKWLQIVRAGDYRAGDRFSLGPHLASRVVAQVPTPVLPAVYWDPIGDKATRLALWDATEEEQRRILLRPDKETGVLPFGCHVGLGDTSDAVEA